MRPRDLATAVLTGLLVAMFALAFAGPITTLLPGPDPLLGVLVPFAVFLLVTWVVYRKRRDADAERARRSVWDAIPRWQYTGRHVESGGITRDGQERALEEVREQAEVEERGRF